MTIEMLMVGLITCAVKPPDKDIYMISDYRETRGQFITVPKNALPVVVNTDSDSIWKSGDERLTYSKKISCPYLVDRYRVIGGDKKRISVKIKED